MKSSTQPIKLFLVLTFSCTSFLASLSSVLAKPTVERSQSDAYGGLRLRSDPKTTLAQTPTFKQPKVPPGPAPGGRIRGGARRGDLAVCPAAKPDLTALMSFTEEANGVINVWGQTTVERPTWFFYVPYTKDLAYTVEFVLHDQDSNPIYQKAIALPDRTGVIRVSLPATAPPLEVNKQYRWFFTINCDKEKKSPPTYVEGVVQRVNLSQATVEELQSAEPIKRYAIYAQNGIWYEALAILAQLRQKNSQDAALEAEWRSLLGSINLDDIAAQPIVSEKPIAPFSWLAP